MMLTLAVHLLVVSALLGIAAVLLERILRPQHRATRYLWLLAMLAAIVVPTLAAWTRAQPATSPGDAGPVLVARDGAVDSRRWTMWIDLSAHSISANDYQHVDRAILWLWSASTALTSSFFILSAWHFRLRQRAWRPGIVAGVPVLIAPDTGPAVFGMLRPQIVVPEWLVNAPSDLQNHVLAHEQTHLQAHDSTLLALSMIPVVLAPWNVVLWWQARRLRSAIEVDCDRRVLSRGLELRRYTDVLVQFSLRRSGFPGAVASMSESPSNLERRIAFMNQPRTTRWTVGAIARAALALVAGAVATFMVPPAMTLAAPTANGESAALDDYVGQYEFATITILKIRRQNEELLAVFPGTSGDLLSKRAEDEFRYKDVDATIRFKRDTKGHITGLDFEQNAAVTHAPRIASARVQTIQGTIAERYRKQIAAVDSEQALRRLIEGIQSGSPNYAQMSPQLAGGTRTMLKNLQSSLRALGSMRSIEFKGVSEVGWDEYRVTHERGAAGWQIALDNRGVIVGALLDAGS